MYIIIELQYAFKLKSVVKYEGGLIACSGLSQADSLGDKIIHE